MSTTIKLPARMRAGIWILAFAAVAVTFAPAADGSMSRYFPVFPAGRNGFLGLALVNTAGMVNEATVTWTGADGNGARTGRLSLPPGTQRAVLVREILGTPEDPQDGWILVASSQPGLVAYLTSGTDDAMDGLDPASQSSTAILLPHVEINTGFTELDYTDTLVVLVNPGGAAAGARADLISIDGRPAGSIQVSIPASGSRTIRVSESFRDVMQSNGLGGQRFDGYLQIVADAGLAGWLQIETPLSRRMLRGRAPEDSPPVPLAMASHFASGGALLYRSALNLVNVGDTSARLELVVQDDRGKNIGTAVQLTLNPGQGMREDVMSLFHVVTPAVYPPPLITGYIRIRGAGGGVFRAAGDVDIRSGGNTAGMLSPIFAAASGERLIPFAVNGKDYFTGYAIANPNELLTVQTDVTVELLDPEGLPAADPLNLSLSPSARVAGVVGKEVRSGYIRIRASGPIVVNGSIGTCDGSSLAFLPAY